MDVLKGLALDAWYMVAIAVGAVVLVLALTVPLQFPNGPVALMGLGALLWGVGEWRNHPRQQFVMQVMNRVAHGHHFPRINTLLGNTLAGLGLLAMGGGGWLLVRTLHQGAHG